MAVENIRPFDGAWSIIRNVYRKGFCEKQIFILREGDMKSRLLLFRFPFKIGMFGILVVLFLIFIDLQMACGENPAGSEKIIFLHHSTGENIWHGGVLEWFEEYNSQNQTSYEIVEQEFPKDSPYGWANYPYDYWNIWVNHAGDKPYKKEPTLEILTPDYDIIVFKHCFPVSDIEEDHGEPDISSSDKTIENYKLQYNALKEKMRQFPDTHFIVWTGAAQVKNSTDEEFARRAKEFFDWVRGEWDEKGDNIYIWDFRKIQTEGELYFKDSYASDSYDSHPGEDFSSRIAPLFCARIIDVIKGNGDQENITPE